MLCWILSAGGLLIMMGRHDCSEALFYYFRLGGRRAFIPEQLWVCFGPLDRERNHVLHAWFLAGLLPKFEGSHPE
jgi:hypothetical protein